MSEIRVLVLDVEEDKGLYEAKIEQNDIHQIYPLIACSCFDIATRRIKGKYFDIFCDDEGLFKDSPTVSAVFMGTMSPALVENLMFANHDAEGNTTGLSDEDIELIKSRIVRVADPMCGKMFSMIMLDPV